MYFFFVIKMTRILVTGGSGFIGNHLCRKLLNEGNEVICLDNLFTSEKSNIADLLVHPKFEFVRHDVTEPFLFEIDQIYNLACPASPVHYQYNPIKTSKTSFLGTMNALGLAKRTSAKILQASTSEIYGDPEIPVQTESYWGNVNPIGVRSCYDEGKRIAETLCFDYKRQHDVDVKVVRIFNTYGPNMHPYDGRVVSNFVLQALANEPITIYGDGSQTRSFCFVDDLVDGLVKMMASDEAGPINMGNPNEMSISQLAELIIELSGSESVIDFKDLPKDDPKRRKPDITKAREKLGWEPSVHIRDGLLKTIEYFNSIKIKKFRKPTLHTAHKNSNPIKSK